MDEQARPDPEPGVSRTSPALDVGLGRRRPRTAGPAISRPSELPNSSLPSDVAPTEACQAVPNLLEILECVEACPSSVADDPRIKVAINGDLGTEVNVFVSAIARMVSQFIHAEPKTWMPLDRAGQAASCGFDCCASIAGIQYQCLYITVEPNRTVNLCLDMTVQGIQILGLSQFDERAAGGDTKGGRLSGAVGVAERGARKSLSGEPEVRGAEPRRAADRITTVVQRPVHGTLVGRSVVVCAGEDMTLPAPPIPAGMSGQTAVARTCHELRAIDTVFRHLGQDGTVPRCTIGMKVHRHP